jgi:hypothetical protein
MACTIVHSASIILSTAGSATLGGENIGDGDIVSFDPDANTTSILFDEPGKFVANEDIDAVHVRANGHILFSTRSPGTFTGSNTNTLDFLDGDIVEYNPSSNTASIFFNESNFGPNLDITAFHLLDNGHFVISTENNSDLGAVGNGDLIEYDPVAMTAISTPFFSKTLFTFGTNTEANIDAVHVLANGNIVLSTFEDGLTLGGLTFGNGDLVEYDPLAKTASLFFAETSFGSMNEDIDAVHIGATVIPLPAAVWLFGGGLLGLAGVARRSTR